MEQPKTDESPLAQRPPLSAELGDAFCNLRTRFEESLKKSGGTGEKLRDGNYRWKDERLAWEVVCHMFASPNGGVVGLAVGQSHTNAVLGTDLNGGTNEKG